MQRTLTLIFLTLIGILTGLTVGLIAGAVLVFSFGVTSGMAAVPVLAVAGAFLGAALIDA